MKNIPGDMQCETTTLIESQGRIVLMDIDEEEFGSLKGAESENSYIEYVAEFTVNGPKFGVPVYPSDPNWVYVDGEPDL